MKLIITESQYNRVFNKPKTKLVITESQYKMLLAEAEIVDLSKIIQKLKINDEILLHFKNNDTLKFKVYNAFSGLLILFNDDEGIFKNNYYQVLNSSLQNGELNTKYINKKNIPSDVNTIAGLNDLIKTKGKKYTFKNLNKIEVDGDLGFVELDLRTGDVKPGGQKEPGKENVNNSEPNEEDTRTDAINDILNNIRESKIDDTYVFEFKNGGQLNVIVTSKDSSSVSWEIDSAYGSDEADRYKDLVGNQIEFKLDPKNIDLKVKEVKDDKTGKVIFKPDYADIKMKKYIGGAEDGDDVKSKSEDFIIYAIDNYISSDIKSQIDSEEDEFSGLSDDEIEAQYKKFMEDDKILRNALWRKPNAFLEFIGVAKERGIIPADEKLAGWFEEAEKNKKLLKDFKTGEQKMVEFTQFRVTNDKVKSIPMKEGRRYYTIVKKRGPGDIYPNLATNFEDRRTTGAFKYRIDIKKELEDNDNFKIYEVVLKERPENGKKFQEIGQGKIKIVKSNKDKNKEEK